MDNKDTIICEHCGQEIDLSDLTQVFAHMQVPHRPIKVVTDINGKPIKGKRIK
ncbi:MAG: hypothetical protein ABFC57_12815 [Veillonellales bacterium]